MKTRIDLTPYENMYEAFDKGHDSRHLKEVRSFAIELGKKCAPDKLELIYVAATMHDVGLSVERENHELHGYELVEKSSDFRDSYSQNERNEILEAIKEHRASSGNPQGIVAKIVSDADKVSDGTKRAFQRAYDWGVKHFPQVNHYGQLLRAAQHLYIKFGPNGTGRRLYFNESELRHSDTYKPIFEALDNDDIQALEKLLESGGQTNFHNFFSV